MFQSFRQKLIVTAAVLNLIVAGPLHAQQPYTTSAPSAGAIIADVVLARPAGLAATVVGSAVFLVALPFALLTGSTDVAAERLVVEPASYTFARPLGEDL